MAVKFACSGGCMATAGTTLATTPSARHLSDRLNATPQQTDARNPGGWVWEFNTTAASAESYIEHLYTGTGGTIRFYLRFKTALPTTDAVLFNVPAADGVNPCRILFRVATGDIITQVGNVSGGSTAQVVVANTWYRIDYHWEFAASPRLCGMKVNGVDKGTSSVVQAASTSVKWRMGGGASNGNPSQGRYLFTDILFDDTYAAYPLPDGQGAALVLTADGTHGFSAAGDFRYSDSSDIPLGATDTFSFIDNRLAGITSFMATGAALGVGEYLEWRLGGMPAAGLINGVNVVVGAHAPNTTANKQTLRIVDGATVADVYTDGDFSVTSMVTYEKFYATKPSGGAWTAAALNALRFRFGSSWTAVDNSPSAYFDGLVAEVDFQPSTAVSFQIPDAPLRLSLAMPEGLDGFDRRLQLGLDDRVHLGLVLRVPTFKVTNPDTGGADPAVDPSFTAQSVIIAARDRHASFDRVRHPDPILLRRLDQLQRQFLIEAVQRNSSFMAQQHTIAFPLADFSAGSVLGFAYHRIHGGDVYFTDLFKGEFSIVEYGSRNVPGPIFSGWVHGSVLYFRGVPGDWTGVQKVVLSYVPTVARITQLRSLFQLPRSAETAFVDNLAFFMASRGHNDPQLPAINVGALAEAASRSEEAFYVEIAGRRRTGAKYVKDVM